MSAADYVVLKIKCGVQSIYVLSVYRPPGLHNKNCIFKHCKVIYSGDININLLNHTDSNVILYKSLFSEYGFIKCISSVTRREVLIDKVTGLV